MLPSSAPPHLWAAHPYYHLYSAKSDPLYSPKTESPITPTDPRPYDPPALADPAPPFLPADPAPAYDKPPAFAAARHPHYAAPPARASAYEPPDRSPADEIADPWAYPASPQYPHGAARDGDAYDAHGRHARHALYPARGSSAHEAAAAAAAAAAAYRRPPAPPPAPAPPALVPEHQLTETHSIPPETLDSFFATVGVAGNSGRRAWVCQQCTKPVRKQDRAAHMLSHQGKKRYDCRCGKRFGRPQDADRHIREQAPCQTCEGKMGRYGKDGRCSNCVLELEHAGIRG